MKEKVALCRCGASSNKPFCDGSHASIEWDGSENALAGTYGERAKSYGGDGIEVFDDRPTCVHAGFCGNQVTNVWKMAAKTGDGQTIEPDFPVEVAVIPDGPLWVSGGIEVTQSDGTKLETRNRVTLCRCGQSASKPLCDGSHQAAGFIG